MEHKKNGRKISDRGLSALTILMSLAERDRLHRLVKESNEMLGMRVSQAAIVRRAIAVYADYLAARQEKLALKGDEEELFDFLRSERASVYRTSGIPGDGVDPAKEWQRRAEESVAEMKEKVQGKTDAQAREALGMNLAPPPKTIH